MHESYTKNVLGCVCNRSARCDINPIRNSLKKQKSMYIHVVLTPSIKPSIKHKGLDFSNKVYLRTSQPHCEVRVAPSAQRETPYWTSVFPINAPGNPEKAAQANRWRPSRSQTIQKADVLHHCDVQSEMARDNAPSRYGKKACYGNPREGTTTRYTTLRSQLYTPQLGPYGPQPWISNYMYVHNNVLTSSHHNLQ